MSISRSLGLRCMILQRIPKYVDHNPYEGKFKGEEAPVFPHDLPALRERIKIMIL